MLFTNVSAPFVKRHGLPVFLLWRASLASDVIYAENQQLWGAERPKSLVAMNDGLHRQVGTT